MKLLPLGLALLATAPAIASDWTLDPAASSVTFTTEVFSRPLTGSFGRFDADITFDRADLESARIEGRIFVASGATGNAQYDSEMTGIDGLDAEHHPVAVFVSTQISESDLCADAEGDCYVADGRLTIAGTTKAAQLPFRLVIDGDRAAADGHFTIHRGDFDVGSGLWGSEGENVEVWLHIEAIR
ncbi:YceI family protein [Hyphobacterium sp. HN65]|uniref:YceI family protein n=1 Tax=Hyphobacterium lacteum TaxID=3116575 RepID=A0ABU7LMT1_9PROT|nr:YceI family protein [Hyphobacterium sp. HN65]MEE2525236.1 YceI family protein [Hyphobacterium sp. HN65]